MTAFEHAAAEAGGPCAYQYTKHGQPRPDLVCPDHPYFTVRLPDAALRKARMACPDHLPDVIWQMQSDHGLLPGGYDGEYILTAAVL